MSTTLFNENNKKMVSTVHLRTISSSKELYVMHTVYNTTEKLTKTSKKIPDRELYSNTTLKKLAHKPAEAIATIKDEANDIRILVSDSKKYLMRVVSYKGTGALASSATITLLDDNRILSTNVYSKSLYWLLLAKGIYENDMEITKNWHTLDYSRAKTDNIFFEKDQFENFGILNSSLFAEARKIDSFYFLDFTAEKKEMKEYLKNENWHDITSCIQVKTSDGPDNFFDAILSSQPDKVEVEPIEFASKANKAGKLQDFLSQDWSKMSDEQAEELPPFLQLERKKCRELYESNKQNIPWNICNLIKQIHAGDIRNLSFSGPAGSGKTTYAKIIAGCLHLPLQLVVGKAGVDSSVYLGYESIKSENGASVTKWHDGNITQAVRYGAVLLFDEINLTDPEVIGSLNTLLDDSRCLVLDNGEVVPAHPNFLFIESMNIGAGYDGTQKMNNSHADRMERSIRLKLPSCEEEIKILKQTTGYQNEEILKKLIHIESFIRENIVDPSTQFVSIRRTQAWIKAAKHSGEWLESAIETMIAPLIVNDETYQDFDVQTLMSEGGLPASVYQEIEDTLDGVECDPADYA